MKTVTRTLMAVCVLCMSIAVSAEPLRVFTAHFPPYTYTSNKQVTGLATIIVKAALADAEIATRRFEVMPWARAYSMASNGKNALIYSIARTPEREKLFRWVGPIAPYEVSLYKLRSRADISLRTLVDARAYEVGGEFLDVKQAYLLAQGFVDGLNLELVSTPELNIRKLFAGRIDLLPMSKTTIPYWLPEEGFSPEALEEALPIAELSKPLYIALTRDVPESTVVKLQTALDNLRARGFVSSVEAAFPY